MSDRPVPPRPACVSQEQWDRISGGDCSPNDLIDFGAELQQQYHTLVEFTSYVIERVAGS